MIIDYKRTIDMDGVREDHTDEWFLVRGSNSAKPMMWVLGKNTQKNAMKLKHECDARA